MSILISYRKTVATRFDLKCLTYSGFLVLAMFLALSAPVHANGSVLKNSSLVLLPTAGIQVTKNDHGGIAIVSMNGRYEFQRVYDSWAQQELTTLEGAIASVKTIPRNGPKGLDYSQLNPIEFGEEGLPVVTIFLDPTCTHVATTEICEQLYKDITTSKDYQFQLIPVAMTPHSNHKANRMVCLGQEEAKKAMLDERMVIDIAPNHKDCHQGVLLSRNVAFKLIGNTQQFLLVGPHGERLDEIPTEGLSKWLEGV